MSAYDFKKYFTLEEAVSCLPWVMDQLKQAHIEMQALRDAAILSKRLVLARQSSGRKTSDAEVVALQERFEAFEDALARWVEKFGTQGILLRDVETGLIDFPYKAESTNEDYFLCWRLHEDGIFYFHGVNEGFAGRHPITLLPD